jgi:uncharacterized protein YebE (UPF0316 family)
MDFAIPAYVLPFAICAARVVDVSLGTLRTVAVVRGRVGVAAALGFFEVGIWVIAISKVMTSLDNPFNIVGYATGYALGNAVGILIEKKLALGKLVMRLFSRDKGRELADALRGRGLRVTEFDGRGKLGPVMLLYVILDRHDADAAQAMAEKIDEDVFIAIEDSRSANRALYPTMVPASGWRSFLRRK